MANLVGAGAVPERLRDGGNLAVRRHRAAAGRLQLLPGKIPSGFSVRLVQVRDNVEPIFMYGGERQETDQLHHRFSRVVANFKQLFIWKRNLGFLTESYVHIAMLVPYVFLAAGCVAGWLQFGQVSPAAAAFM